MKNTSIRILFVLALLVTLFSPGWAQGELWLRLTFNTVETGAPYDTFSNDGGSATAYHGRAYNTTNPDRPGIANDKMVNFPGNVNAYVDIRSDSSSTIPSDLNANGMTIAYWVKYDMTAETQDQSYMTLLTTHTNEQFANIQQHLKYPCNPGGGCSGPYTQRWFCNSMRGKVTVNNSQWYHLVYTIDSGIAGQQTGKYYVDGQLEATVPSITASIGSAPTRFGITDRGGFTEKFAGDLDQLDIFDNCLTDGEVTALFQEGPKESIPAQPPQNCAEVIAAANGAYKMQYDFNDDCYVDIQDFVVINQIWMKCIVPTDDACDKPWEN